MKVLSLSMLHNVYFSPGIRQGRSVVPSICAAEPREPQGYYKGPEYLSNFAESHAPLAGARFLLLAYKYSH